MKPGDIVIVDSYDLAGLVTSVSDGRAAVVSFDGGISAIVAESLCRHAEFPLWSGTYDYKPSKGHVILRRRLIFKEPVAVFDFRNDEVNPLTFWKSPAEFIRPPRHFDQCDLGSVPLLLQGMVSPTCAPRTYAVHDGGFEIRMWETEKGLVRLTLSDANWIVYPGMRAEGCSRYLAGKAYAGVKAGSWAVWNDRNITEENEARCESAHKLTTDAATGRAGMTA